MPEYDRINIDGNRVPGQRLLRVERRGLNTLVDDGDDSVDDGNDPKETGTLDALEIPARRTTNFSQVLAIFSDNPISTATMTIGPPTKGPTKGPSASPTATPARPTTPTTNVVIAFIGTTPEAPSTWRICY